jgi:hypothetical protein
MTGPAANPEAGPDAGQDAASGSGPDAAADTAPDPGKDDSVDARERLLLREEVGRFRARESRRVFDSSVHVGELAGDRTGFVLRAQDLPAMDAALRADIVSRLVEQSPAQWRTAWLVRPGTPEQHDLDLQWLSAFHIAFGVHGRPLDACYVITRSGWRDLRTDSHQVWARLRL